MRCAPHTLMQEEIQFTFHELHWRGAHVSGSALPLALGTVPEAAMLSGAHLDNQQAPSEDGLQLLQLLIFWRRLLLWLRRAALLLIRLLHQHTTVYPVLLNYAMTFCCQHPFSLPSVPAPPQFIQGLCIHRVACKTWWVMRATLARA